MKRHSNTSNLLPIYDLKDQLLHCLKERQVVILKSPTGSGKTTQLPLILHEADYTKKGSVVVTQPRRIATLSVYEYLKKIIGDEKIVGYKMRFSEHLCSETRLRVVTDGTLLQEIKHDPLLEQYSVVIVDEAHERSLTIDILLGLLKRILPQRPDLKIIISSATINAEAFTDFFHNAPLLSIDHKPYPVRKLYYPVNENLKTDLYLQEIALMIFYALEQNTGDLLVFLEGIYEIHFLIKILQKNLENEKYILFPLYARLSSEEQIQVFKKTPKGKIKIVIATNIAETSITVDGITTVIDSGRARLNYYHPSNHVFSLLTESVSKASCEQRAGRAGRTEPGVCYRLYSRKNYEKRKDYTLEEIKRTELSELVLRMADLNITRFEEFPFLLPPDEKALVAAMKNLKLLGALDREGKITPLGKKMHLFPLLPQHARILLEAATHYPEILHTVIIFCAFLSSPLPFLNPTNEEQHARKIHLNCFSENSQQYGDFAVFANLYTSYVSCLDKPDYCKRYYLDITIMRNIESIVEQLRNMVQVLGVRANERVILQPEILSCLLKGFPLNICRKNTFRSFSSLNLKNIHIHPGSLLCRHPPSLLLAVEIVETSRLFARTILPLPETLLKKEAPKIYKGLFHKK